MKKIFSIGMLALMLCSSLVFAQQNKVNYGLANQNEIQKMEQNKNMFQNKYNFTCEGECDYRQLQNSTNHRLEVRNQKRFLFWNVESLEVYDIAEDGELVQARYNFWSRLLNRNKVKA